jgi:hypothetical protein
MGRDTVNEQGMTRRLNETESGELDLIKRRAAIKLEADLHAYLDCLAAVGVSERDAIELARSILRSAISRASERRQSAR